MKRYKRMTLARKAQLKRRLRYLVREMESEGVELMSSTLSATFTLTLLRSEGRTIVDWFALWAAVCLTAALLKLLGVVLEHVWLRRIGLGLGCIWWTMFSWVSIRDNPTSIAYLCFLAIALWQLWCIYRLSGAGRRQAVHL